MHDPYLLMIVSLIRALLQGNVQYAQTLIWQSLAEGVNFEKGNFTEEYKSTAHCVLAEFLFIAKND